MKGIFRMILTGVCIGLLVSCTKDMNRYQGDYSFKTSGVLLLAEAGGGSAADSAVAEPVLQAELKTELGQMHIMRDKEGEFDKSMKITMNILGGGVMSFDAYKAEGKIFIVPATRSIRFTVNSGISADAEVLMCGVGKRLDDVLLFELDYQGDCMYRNTMYRITESRVTCIAEANEK